MPPATGTAGRLALTHGFRNISVDAGVPSIRIVCSQEIVNVSVYNTANEGTMYTAPSPFDEPTKPIDAQALRAWWARQRNEKQVIERRKPERVALIRRR